MNLARRSRAKSRRSVCADLGVLTQYDGGGDVLAKSPMEDRESGGFDHVWVAQQRLFDLGGRDLLPSSIDDLLDSANNEEVSVADPSIQGHRFGTSRPETRTR